MLLGFGATAIYPDLAYETLAACRHPCDCQRLSYRDAQLP
ncbi:hypothetical protein ACLK17_19795 [Escherichia coli]